MKIIAKYFSFYIVFAISSIVGFSFLIGLSEPVVCRIAIVFILGVFFLFPTIIITILINNNKINRRWYIAIAFLIIFFVSILVKLFSLSDKELMWKMKKIEPMVLISS